MKWHHQSVLQFLKPETVKRWRQTASRLSSERAWLPRKASRFGIDLCRTCKEPPAGPDEMNGYCLVEFFGRCCEYLVVGSILKIELVAVLFCSIIPLRWIGLPKTLRCSYMATIAVILLNKKLNLSCKKIFKK